jgi:glycosyltransferase involved in cell wall biosynthesis
MIATIEVRRKVLFIIDSLTCGGAEKSLVSLLSQLNQDKYELYLWLRNPVGIFLKSVPQNITIVESPEYTLAESVRLKIAEAFYSLIWRLNRLIGRHEHRAETLYKCVGKAMKVPTGKWHVVVAYQQGLPTYLVADKFHGCKKLAWVNVDIFNAGYNARFNSHFYSKIDQIVLVSDALHEVMSKCLPLFSDKYHVVYDIINPDMVRSMAQEPTKRLKTEADEYILITVGRLVLQKNYIIAVEAASELKKRGVKFKWFLIGEGGERAHIEQAITDLCVKECVLLLGEQSNPYAYMCQADVYVQTSSFEGFGMTIAEAKILGRPVVSTNFGVVYNQLTHEKNGLIANMNGKSIADNIYRMITDDALRNSIITEVNREENTTYSTETKKVEQMIDL